MAMTKRKLNDPSRLRPLFYPVDQMLELLHLEDPAQLFSMVESDAALPVPVDVAGRPMWLIAEVERWAAKLNGYTNTEEK